MQAIESADPQQLASALENEHPQAVALMLARLPAARAAAVLKALPLEMRPDVALRLASLDQISPEVAARIAEVISRRLQAFGDASPTKYGGIRAAGEIFNQLDAATSEEVLSGMEEVDANVAESIRNVMFVFDDLVKLDQSAIKELMSRVDRKLLTVALKGTSEQLKQKILKSMSQRGAEMLLEDMEAAGPVRIRDVEAAQQQVIALVRQLERDGLVSTSGEQYIV
jgi:flagellar motor switch protein FliG